LASFALPERQDIAGDNVEVRFAGIGIDTDLVLAAVGETELVKAGLGELERLRRRGLAKGERALPLGVCNLDALTLFPGIAELEVGIYGSRAALSFAARKVSRSLFNKGDEGGI
jgi:hypothetical protein